MKHLIDEKKHQYKANLHCHTNLSDGKWTPERVKEEYKKRGYAIVAITDHERLVSHNELSDGEILFLTAYEAYIRNLPYDGKVDPQSHINLYSKTPENKIVYFTPNHTKYTPKEEWDTLPYHHLVENRAYTVEFLRKMIADAVACGYLVCHNHPTWSYEEESMGEAYADCFAMEIYNHSADRGEGHSEMNEHFYDYQLRHGRRMALIAADDNHNHRAEDDPRFDSFGGFTYILADKLDYASVIDAMERKDFYASQGPVIHSLTADGDTLTIRTSDAKSVYFITNVRSRTVVHAAEGEVLTEATCELSERVEWVYVIVQDASGKRAYTRAYTREELAD